MSFFSLRDMQVAGVVLGHRKKDHILQVDLDFAIPQYRDFKLGKYIYERKPEYFAKKDIRKIYARPGSQKFRKYLLKMGFRKSDSENFYCKTPENLCEK